MDKSEARADAPCGGVAVAGSSTTMRRRETLRWRWRPDRTTVRWRRAAWMLGPLLGRGRSTPGIKTRRRGVCWYLEKNQRLGCVDVDQVGGRWRWRLDDEGARVPAGGRTRGDIGLGGCAGNITRDRFGGSSKTSPDSVSAVFQKLPPLKILEGRVAIVEQWRWIFNVSFRFSPYGRSSSESGYLVWTKPV